MASMMISRAMMAPTTRPATRKKRSSGSRRRRPDAGVADADGGVMMDYFDSNFLKNWAGPEHWKLRKVVRRRGLSLIYHITLY